MKTRLIAIVLMTLTCSVSAQSGDATSWLKVLRVRKQGVSPGSVSEETITAASKLFSSISFLNKTKKETIALIGPPTETKKDKSDEVLIYRYDSGFGGYDYYLSLRADRVFKVEVVGID